MTPGETELARAAVAAGLFWSLTRWPSGRDVLLVRGSGVPQLSRLMGKINAPVDVSPHGNYGVRWIATARDA